MTVSTVRSEESQQCLRGLVGATSAEDAGAIRNRLIDQIQSAGFASDPALVEAADFIAGRRDSFSSRVARKSRKLRMAQFAERFFQLEAKERSQRIGELRAEFDDDSEMLSRLDWLQVGVGLEQNPADRLSGRPKEQAEAFLEWFVLPESERGTQFAEVQAAALESLRSHAPGIAALVEQLSDNDGSPAANVNVENAATLPSDLVSQYREGVGSKRGAVDFNDLRDSIEERPLALLALRLGTLLQSTPVVVRWALLGVMMVLGFVLPSLLNSTSKPKVKTAVVDKYCNELKAHAESPNADSTTGLVASQPLIFQDLMLSADRDDAFRALSRYADTCEAILPILQRERESARNQASEISRVVRNVKWMKPCCDKHARESSKLLERFRELEEELATEPAKDRSQFSGASR